MRAMILIPTYNEATSVVELLHSLKSLRDLKEFDFDVTVIDDNSPDKTAEIVASLNLDWVSILKREKKDGLGNAYRAGFAQVLSDSSYDQIVTMDADGSHRVADLPAMFAAISSGKSIVLGTRWIPGGSVVNWPKSRQLLSRSGTRYASLALGIKLADLTGGFRIYSRQLLESLNLKKMDATGYCFQIEMALAAHLAGATAKQVPITFVERINGVSKMSRAIVIEALLQTTRWGVKRRLRPNADKLHYVK
ncbi:MAG: glycosyltransferase [Actinobacteria bacterium]|nr:glycosyltransferase [Actinomycetota bacterium]